LNKIEFVTELAKMTNLPKAKALGVTNAIIDILSEKLNEKEKIQFVGFGTLEVKHSPERLARNPRTLEPVMIPERYKAVFKPSEGLLDKLNKSIKSTKSNECPSKLA